MISAKLFQDHHLKVLGEKGDKEFALCNVSIYSLLLGLCRQIQYDTIHI